MQAWTGWLLLTSCTAQGCGGSFKIGNPEERLFVVMHGWQSEVTDGPEGGWSCVFGVVVVAMVVSPTTAGCSVVECSCSCVCSVVEL